jgi:hypothetical protein
MQQSLEETHTSLTYLYDNKNTASYELLPQSRQAKLRFNICKKSRKSYLPIVTFSCLFFKE